MTSPDITKRKPGATARARHLRRDETDAEYRLWYHLRGRELGGYKFVRQAPLGPFIVDFLCRSAALVIELDGAQHAENSTDSARDAWLNNQGYSVLRFWNDEVLKERDAVLDAILAVLEGTVSAATSGLRLSLAPSPGRCATRPLPNGERNPS